ncbi:MAG: hypothetical protein ATN32_03780 [Candidatus Epulonipiscium fishelsonii]|nr:MAG: hypothetical protein ATN32_03780 [Epulopiscium sp. AS2M-Bin002]
MNNLQKQKEEILIRLGVIDQQLEGGANLEAIKAQRWFFFKNKDRVLMDKFTGLLWANLRYFPYNGKSRYNLTGYDFAEAQDTVNEYDFNGIEGFRLPTSYELKNIMDETFPFREIVQNAIDWHFDNKDRIYRFHHEGITLVFPPSSYTYIGFTIPCSSILVDNTDYVKHIDTDNEVYNEREKLQFTSNLFKQNNLVPVFDDDKITQLYTERLELVEQLREIEKQMQEKQMQVSI